MSILERSLFLDAAIPRMPTGKEAHAAQLWRSCFGRADPQDEQHMLVPLSVPFDRFSAALFGRNERHCREAGNALLDLDTVRLPRSLFFPPRLFSLIDDFCRA